MGGGGESAEAAIRALLPYLKGHDPLQLEQLRWKIMNPTASLYNNRIQLHAALEMACMDRRRQDAWHPRLRPAGRRAARARAVRDLPLLPLSRRATGKGGETTPDEIVAHARDLEAALRLQDAQAEGRAFRARP